MVVLGTFGNYWNGMFYRHFLMPNQESQALEAEKYLNVTQTDYLTTQT